MTNYLNEFRLLFFCFIGYFLGLFVDVMEIDAAQYASISMEMVQRKSYLKIFIRGENYLDKPPLTFWLASLFFQIFGFKTWSYKLPSLFFGLLALFYTFLFTRKFYNFSTARWATLILASSQAWFLMINDCRTDMFLTGSVTMALYHLFVFIEERKVINCYLGFLGIGLAMLAKGPIGFLLPCCSLFLYATLKRKWEVFTRWHWLGGILVVAFMLFPMCIGLYEQHGLEGLKFFFWKQSFGRITGDNEFVKNLSSDYVNDPYFFYHTFLWAFLPWSLLSYAAFFKLIYDFLNKRMNNYPELVTWLCVIFTFLAMSLSKYKLPHYIFICFPMMSIVTAHYVLNLISELEKKYILWIYAVVPVIFLAIMCYLMLMSFKKSFVVDFLLICGSVVAVWYLSKEQSKWISFLKRLFLMVSFGNILLNGFIYPRLLKYQWGSEIGKVIKEHSIQDRTIVYCEHTYALDFYSGKILKNGTVGDQKWFNLEKGEYVIIGGDDVEMLKTTYNYEIVKQVDSYHVTLLTPDFLNPKTRDKTLRKRMLVKILGKNEV
jgi:4-amino-4-deoxy-L-arabinose transferase-like glycosyltransferase